MVTAKLLEKLEKLARGYAHVYEVCTRRAARTTDDAGRKFAGVDSTAAELLHAGPQSRVEDSFTDGLLRSPHTVNNLRLRRSELTEEMASRLHELWRAPRLGADGRYEPRIKSVRDDLDWIAAHGADRVDIANTAYRDLPLDYRRENQESAKVAIALVLDEYLAGRDPSSADFTEAASRLVHDAWLERNRSWAPPDQSRSYDRLTEEEKEKDRVVVRAAVDLLNEQPRSTQ